MSLSLYIFSVNPYFQMIKFKSLKVRQERKSFMHVLFLQEKKNPNPVLHIELEVSLKHTKVAAE